MEKCKKGMCPLSDKSGTVRYTYDKYDHLSKQSFRFTILEKRCI